MGPELQTASQGVEQIIPVTLAAAPILGGMFVLWLARRRLSEKPREPIKHNLPDGSVQVLNSSQAYRLNEETGGYESSISTELFAVDHDGSEPPPGSPLSG